MSQPAIGYLLERRASRQSPDRLVPLILTLSVLGWLLIVALMGRPSLNDVRIVATAILFCATPVALIGLALRQIQGDAGLHASLQGGNCYPEVLGTLLRPAEIIDQIAAHSAKTYLKLALRWTPVFTAGWLILQPASAGLILTWALAWIPLSTLFVWTTSFLAQQFIIFQSQMQAAPGGSLGENLIGIATGLPLGLMGILALVGWFGALPKLALGGTVAYGLLCLMLNRRLAAVGINRLPHLRLRLQQLGRRWTDFRNRFLVAWTDNPIVVRELRRDARWLPLQMLGAWLYMFPMSSLIFLIASRFPAMSAYEARLVNHWLILACALLSYGAASARCGMAIAAEVEAQSMEPLQNTRLRSEEFLWGWIQVGAVPRLVDGLLLCLVCQACLGQLPIDSALVLLVAPLAGAVLGLSSSYASSRQAAQRQRGEALALHIAGWLFLKVVLSALNLNWLDGQLVLAGYLTIVSAFSLAVLRSRIDVVESH